MIKNFVFDIGGVLLEYNPNTYLDKLNLSKKDKERLNEIIFRNPKFKDLLNGKISTNELIDYFVKNNKDYEKQIINILDYNNQKYMMPPKLDSIEYLKQLKQNKYNVYILSNITIDTYNYINYNFDFINLTDGGIYSCFEGVSKPNEEIYLSLIEKYKIAPEETVFIDDTRRNVEKANSLGFNSILFSDLTLLKKQVNELPGEEVSYEK